MRHPGTSCFLVILWLHPLMTWQRFIFAIMFTIYVLLGFSVTEEDYVYTKTVWYYEETTYVTEESYLHTD